MKDTATDFFPLLCDRYCIDRSRFGYGTLTVKSCSGGSRGSPIYWGNVDLEFPFSLGSPKVYDTATIEAEIYGPHVTYFSEI